MKNTESRKEKCKEKCNLADGADMCADKEINTDPDGSWTGVPSEFPYEVPVQDADDL